MDPKRAALLRQLPQVDELLRHPTLLPAVTPLPRALAAAVVRRTLAARAAVAHHRARGRPAPRLDDGSAARTSESSRPRPRPPCAG